MRKFSTCTCARVPSTVRHRFGKFGFKWQRGKHVVSGFVSAQEADFHLPFHDFDSFHASFRTFVCIQCTKCQECRKTYYCVVVQGMRWCFCFVSCHEWSILGVRFWSRSCGGGSRASASDVHTSIPYLFRSLRQSVCQSWGAFLAAFPFKREHARLYWFSTQTLDFSVTVMKCLQTGNTEQRFFLYSAVCEGTDERIPIFLFFIGRNSLSILCPSLTPSCPSCYWSSLYMRKTEQQPSALTISAQLDFFLPFLQWFSSFAHRKSKGRVRSMTSYPNTPFVRTQTSLSWVFSLLDDKVTVGHLVYVTNLCMEKPFGPQCFCLRSACAVVLGVCVSLLASRPWWVAVLNSWK